MLRSRPKWSVTGVGVLVLILGLGTCWSAAANVIRACVNSKGDVRIIAAGSCDPKKETEVDWSAGPTAPTLGTWGAFHSSDIDYGQVGASCSGGTCVLPLTLAKMTLEESITVVRVQHFASGGPPVTFGGGACNGTTDITMTDGTNSVSTVVPTGFSSSLDSDSGTVSVQFSQGATVSLQFVRTFPGTSVFDDNCVFPRSGNATVQYVAGP